VTSEDGDHLLLPIAGFSGFPLKQTEYHYTIKVSLGYLEHSNGAVELEEEEQFEEGGYDGNSVEDLSNQTRVPLAPDYPRPHP